MTDQIEALRKAQEALNVWLHMHAGDMCDEAGVADAKAKIREAGGTLGYITDALDTVSLAIRAIERSDALDAALSPTEADKP